jgi:Tfp pilus assembly protein PilV
MVELLVTVLLAGIIFAAMVPVFASALKRTSNDNFRVTATNIAQDRIEKIRMLNYADITDANLNDSGFAANQFGTSFVTVGGKTYTMDPYEVADSAATAPGTTVPLYKDISVTVRWSAAAGNYTTMQTVVMNPQPVVTGSTPTPTATPSPYSTTGTSYTLTVFCTDNTVLQSGTNSGVTLVRTDVTPNQAQSPAKQYPNDANGRSVTWTGLVGGPNVTYRVTVYFQVPGHSAESKTWNSPAAPAGFMDNWPVYFDTNPYQ